MHTFVFLTKFYFLAHISNQTNICILLFIFNTLIKFIVAEYHSMKSEPVFILLIDSWSVHSQSDPTLSLTVIYPVTERDRVRSVVQAPIGHPRTGGPDVETRREDAEVRQLLRRYVEQ